MCYTIDFDGRNPYNYARQLATSGRIAIAVNATGPTGRVLDHANRIGRDPAYQVQHRDARLETLPAVDPHVRLTASFEIGQRSD